MKKIIDLQELFKSSVCSFEIAKQAKANGFNCENTFYSYDEQGELGDGGWLEKITGAKMYPAFSLPLAMGYLEHTNIPPDKFKDIELSEIDGFYTIKYDTEIHTSKNVIDVILMFVFKHYKK
jgi:hypothetical protein